MTHTSRRILRKLAGTSLLAILYASAALAAEPNEGVPPAAADHNNLFDELDADGDGAVELDEIGDQQQRLFRRLLRTADADENGSLSRDEWLQGLSSTRPPRPLETLDEPAAPDQQPAAVFARLDKNRDGQLGTDEVPAAGRAMWEQFIKNADNNGDGSLNRFEFARNYYRIAQRLNAKPEQIKSFAAATFRRIDKDGDGEVNLDEVPDERRPQFQRLMRIADSNDSGTLSLAEFTEGMRRVQQAMAENNRPSDGKKMTPAPANDAEQNVRQMLSRFMQLDGNGDDKLDEQEVRGPLLRNFKRIDVDADGKLNRDELTRAARFMVRFRQTDSDARPQRRPNDGEGQQADKARTR